MFDQQITVSDTYDYEHYPSRNTSISFVQRENPSSITTKMAGNSKEKQNIVLKHISAQINATMHSNYEYDPQQPSVPHNSYNRSDSNVTRHHNDSIAGDTTGDNN